MLICYYNPIDYFSRLKKRAFWFFYLELKTETKLNFSGANGILLVYDITNPKSFDNIAKWLRNINEHASEEVERMLIGKTFILSLNLYLMWLIFDTNDFSHLLFALIWSFWSELIALSVCVSTAHEHSSTRSGLMTLKARYPYTNVFNITNS